MGLLPQLERFEGRLRVSGKQQADGPVHEKVDTPAQSGSAAKPAAERHATPENPAPR